jgi:hypothetical protein
MMKLLFPGGKIKLFSEFLKKEMDVVIFSSDKSEKHCIELKFPTNGQHPEQMFSACKDIRFLEELVAYDFGESFFVMFADDPLFYSSRGLETGIYKSFRESRILNGEIQEPPGFFNIVVRGVGFEPTKT